ncbi:MAG: HAMP domain-containing histidine kinase [Cyclobacteriaceae bacterium]|nr:HAMP domain-containing histidine kinase [Cyclobacteriaceae bacterium]MCX7636357.1 HAMP domain-containing histidine kinase [Cyclobacteriaceae bacterium]MDW8330286.1 HAMP domain-containing sensor histidine kinase [Cyclobacteriaceae bacterium]
MARPEQYTINTYAKWIVLGASVVISVGSIWYTDVLVKQLKDRERQQVELFARALEYTLAGQPDENMLFVTEEIILKNNSIPVIWITREGEYQHRNIKLEKRWSETQKRKVLEEELNRMKALYEPIPITYRNEYGETEEYGQVYYRNSFLLTQLTYYPFIQLSVIAIFAFISYLAFNYSKVAEQNQVWVGLAKETAHQLGTPLSSLMAWVEVLRDDPHLKNKEIITELEKDIRKLSIVTERFSSIGSVPALKPDNIVLLINNVVNYLRPRISSRISLEVFSLSDVIMVRVNPPLFEWVIENLCKNAVDAIGSTGSIAIKILRGSNNKVYIDITDTGKGISRSNLSLVFKPGFTTKKRGWGLGLALAKRIIENYHNGRIFVKASEENQGTTFRIILPAEPFSTRQ